MKTLEEILGVTLNDERTLVTALTHSSYANENGTVSNERLEYLGDAVLELVVSEHIYTKNPTMPEGDMTRLRASIVCEENLSYHAKRLGLGAFVLLGKGERAGGGAERDSLLADVLEAVLGAVFLDSGLDAARKCVFILLDGISEKAEKTDYKTTLQEVLQRTSASPIVYTVVSETGPDHDKVFVSTVSHLDKEIGRGSGKSKKESEQQAAKMALSSISN